MSENDQDSSSIENLDSLSHQSEPKKLLTNFKKTLLRDANRAEQGHELSSIESLRGNPILTSKIQDVPLTVRIKNALHAENIDYVFELLQHDYSSISGFDNMGRKSFKEFKDFLEENNIYLPLVDRDRLVLPEKPARGDHEANTRYVAGFEAIFFSEQNNSSHQPEPDKLSHVSVSQQNSSSHQPEPKKLSQVNIPLHADFIAAVLHATPTESLVNTLRARLNEMSEEERNQTLKSLEADF